VTDPAASRTEIEDEGVDTSAVLTWPVSGHTGPPSREHPYRCIHHGSPGRGMHGTIVVEQ